MNTKTQPEAQPGDIILRGTALEDPQSGHPAQRMTLFEAARGLRARAQADLERAVVGAAATQSYDFGHTPSASQPVRDAYRHLAGALARADAAIETAARTSVAAAENNDLYKDGRADRIDQAVAEADRGVDDARGVVEGAAQALRAVLEAEALPAVPTGTDHAAALSTLQALMSAASEKDKPALFDRLTARDDALAGWLLGPDGREYATALWGEAGAARHQAARLRALQSALENGNKHARAVRAVADLQSAAGAYRAAWRTIRTNLVGLSNDLRQQAKD